ncbi:MAG: glycosyl hydrolase [Akkermansiaceae bacterium]|nr:glycosyl hydrolase [Verrucomicrobiales bacterium]
MKKILKLTMALTALLITLPSTGSAAAWSSCDKWAIWANGGFYVENDVWGPYPGRQCIWANSYKNWGVNANHTGNRIQSYPNVDKKDINKRVLSLNNVYSSFNATTPSGTVYDLAYDVWLNGSTYEVMVWTKWANTQPIAASYDARGIAVPSYRNQSIGGATYNVYHRGNVTSFLRTSQISSGSVNIKPLLQWINNVPRWYNNPTLAKVQFGWEIINTGGSKNFTMNSYSCTAN